MTSGSVILHADSSEPLHTDAVLGVALAILLFVVFVLLLRRAGHSQTP